MSNRTDIVVETDNAEGQVLLSASRVYDLTEDKTQDTINGEIRNTLNQLEDGIAYIVDGDNSTTTIPAGSFAYLKNNTHGLSEGLYTNANAPFPSGGGTAADSTIFTAASGALNTLKNSIVQSSAWSPEASGYTITNQYSSWDLIGDLVHLHGDFYAPTNINAGAIFDMYIPIALLPQTYFQTAFTWYWINQSKSLYGRVHTRGIHLVNNGDQAIPQGNVIQFDIFYNRTYG